MKSLLIHNPPPVRNAFDEILFEPKKLKLDFSFNISNSGLQISPVISNENNENVTDKYSAIQPEEYFGNNTTEYLTFVNELYEKACMKIQAFLATKNINAEIIPSSQAFEVGHIETEQ